MNLRAIIQRFTDEELVEHSRMQRETLQAVQAKWATEQKGEAFQVDADNSQRGAELIAA